MLQSVLLISGSGLVLFSRHFDRAGPHRLFGGLLRTLIELAGGTTGGAALTHLSFTSSSLFIASHPELPLYCALFYDKEEDRRLEYEFGRVIAVKLVSAFGDEYGSELAGNSYGHALATFKAFAYRIPSLIRDVATTLVQQLSIIPALKVAMLIGDDGNTETYVSSDCAYEVDDVAVLSTVRPLLAASSDLMATVGDSTQHLSILTDRGVRIMATRFDGAVLVMHVSADAGEQHVYEQAGMRLTVLQRVCSIQARIRRQGSGGTGASSMASGSLVGIMDPDFENVGPSMMATIT